VLNLISINKIQILDKFGSPWLHMHVFKNFIEDSRLEPRQMGKNLNEGHDLCEK